ncbi:TPA: hypothetical protein ACHWKL_004156 [Providencia stuartii]|uniref:hypothetical protein n=1 Tax=Providencia stuartii TaxID=588 RepID=UPI001A1AB75C|nr:MULTISPECIES: hypothetical protein [Providencia]MDF4176314.1 hypothetical protein [Providencia thailandensis]MDN0012427.1 hypothetical protein [Providencia stuartii]QUC26560.1 hypothetical protein JY390_04220 [Providencia stuartii]CAK6614972.1 hypothetical protein PSTU1396_15220 [Providencia stuartii]CAK6616108.1 hypothetical protein PSTU1396_17280 [Providencia stuartii]
MNETKILALQQTVAILLHLLPEDKKQYAYNIIEKTMKADYESVLLNSESETARKNAKQYADDLSGAYSYILEQSQSYDEALKSE